MNIKRCEYIIGDNLKRIRNNRKLTQETMAELCGLSDKGYRNIENCKKSATLESLNKIAEGTGYTQVELLTENLVIE